MWWIAVEVIFLFLDQSVNGHSRHSSHAFSSKKYSVLLAPYQPYARL
jgi:hypothetical protein